MTALDSWTNRAGQTVIVHATGITVLDPGQTLQSWAARQRVASLTDVQRDLERLDRAVTAELAAHGVAAQVDAALQDHPDVAALVNERTGAVSTFILPKPPTPR